MHQWLYRGLTQEVENAAFKVAAVLSFLSIFVVISILETCCDTMVS